MICLKRMAAMLLAAVAVSQFFTLNVSATAALDSRSKSQSSVFIGITAEPEEESDFVKEFPSKLSLVDEVTDNPSMHPNFLARRAYTEIPIYVQSDYPDVLYGRGTVETSGSGIVALSMLATYLTGYEYLPDQMACWFAGKDVDDSNRLIYAAQALKLPFHIASDWQTTFEELKSGKSILIQLDNTSAFTNTQHFLVLKGVTEDGKILVIDPCEDHYEIEELKEGFTSGFEEATISKGFRFAWIFDKSMVPEGIAPYGGTEIDSGDSRYTSIQLTPTEKQLLVRAVAVKASGECEEGQQILAEVILNRLLSKNFSNDLKELIYGDEGFCDVDQLDGAELKLAHYQAVEKALYGPYILPKDVTGFYYVCHE